MVYPPIHPFQGLAGVVKEKLSDIEYMSKKQFDGKLLQADGNRTTSGVIASITPATGKTFYVAGGSCSTRMSGTQQGRCQLRNDTVVIEEWEGSASAIPTWFAFQTKGVSLVGNGVKTFDMNHSSIIGSPSISAMLYGFIENDADSPVE